MGQKGQTSRRLGTGKPAGREHPAPSQRRLSVFDQLVNDADANLSNLLIGPDWTLWRIDFSRAFRTINSLQKPENLVHCDRQLLQKLKALERSELTSRTKRYLGKGEIALS